MSAVLTKRADEDRVIAGVAGGIGDAARIDAALVRVAFAMLALASGFGIALYALLALLLPKSTVRRPTARTRTEWDTLQVGAFAAIVAGMLLLLRKFGLWLPDRLMWPLLPTLGGLGLAWSRDDRSTTHVTTPEWASRLGPGFSSMLGNLSGTPRRAVARIGMGVLLVMVGAGALAASNGAFRAGRQALLGSAVLLAGVALTLAPWLIRLSGDLAYERRERIREQERAEIASHLHDSVLQTLTIIQRQANDPRRVAALARRQERELRSWLYGDDATGRSPSDAVTLGAMVHAVTDEIEATYEVRVEVVRVGDAQLDDRVTALVAATREALTNAAKHAGVATVDVYVEVGKDAVEVFVRDRGLGFVLAEVAPDRRGIAESILGRMERVGGSARVTSRPGFGTEVHLRLPGPPTTPPEPTGVN